MKCVAILPSGRPCSRTAEAGSQTCFQHRSAPLTPPPAFYAEPRSLQERRLLAEAAGLEGVDAEVAVLRVLIREMSTAHDLEATRRAIEALARVQKIRRSTGDTADQVNHWLDSVLAEMAQDALMVAQRSAERPRDTTSESAAGDGRQVEATDPPDSPSDSGAR